MGDRVADVLAEKASSGPHSGDTVLSIDGGATVIDAIRRMVDANVGAILVTERDQIVGILTERDYLRRVALEGRSSSTTEVREIMTSPLLVVEPETTVDETMAIMTDRRIRHLPVAVDGQIAGVISIGDVVKFQSKQQSFRLQYLNEYISAR
jgi:signal-transduction protein with cAMP-binding, CBS, and nucleotidyltransferase domain